MCHFQADKECRKITANYRQMNPVPCAISRVAFGSCSRRDGLVVVDCSEQVMMIALMM